MLRIGTTIGGSISHYAKSELVTLHHCRFAIEFFRSLRPVRFYRQSRQVIMRRMIMSLGAVACNKALRRMRLNVIRTIKWPAITARCPACEFTNIARKMRDQNGVGTEMQMEASHIDFLIVN